MSRNEPAPSSVRGTVFDLRILRKIGAFIRPYRGQFVLVTLLVCLLSAVAPFRPYILHHLFDSQAVSRTDDSLHYMVLLLLAHLLVQACTQYFYLYGAGELGQKVVRDIRVRLYSHVQRMSLRFFNSTPVGRLVTRCVSDIETLLDVIGQGLPTIVGDVLQIVFLLFVVFIWNWKLALVGLSVLPLMFISTYIFKEQIKGAFSQVRASVAKMNTFVQEHLTGMHLIQLFGIEAHNFDRFSEINAEQRQAHIRSVLYYSIYFPIVEILNVSGLALLLWYGVGEVMQEALTLGELTAFILYLQMFFRPIRMIADKFNTLQLGVVSAHRIFALLESQDFVTDTGDRQIESGKSVRGVIKFDKVCFAYNDTDGEVLHNVSFSVEPNQMVALVGETGSGKTSTIHLLNRLYEPTEGSITLDGVDLRAYSLKSLRKQVGFVLQDVFLFSDSIRNNITLYDPSVTDDKIRTMAEKLGVWDFMQQLKGGLDYEVRERGGALSVGERQIISFVRAMLYDPKVLVLDEATSSIDNQTERLVQHSMVELMKGRATIVVAHRLSTIQHAHTIFVLEQGKITEQGKHSLLLAKKGTYYKFYQMQQKGASMSQAEASSSVI